MVSAHGLSCLAACGILTPRSGTELVSPAFAGRFFIFGSPGKSGFLFLVKYIKVLFTQSKILPLHGSLSFDICIQVV